MGEWGRGENLPTSSQEDPFVEVPHAPVTAGRSLGATVGAEIFGREANRMESLRRGGGHMSDVTQLEEKVIASWRYKKGALDRKTASLCYLAANLAAGNTH